MATEGAPGIVAVTGVTGFVGRHVLRRLLHDDVRVRALVRGRERLRAISLPLAARERLTVIDGDLRDEEALKRLFEGAEIAIHVAGVVKAAKRAHFHAVNAEAAGRVARIAKESGVIRFVHVSSLAARAAHLSAYAASKRAGEEAVLAELGESAVIVRPPAVYGPEDEATFGLIDQLSRRHAFIPGHAQMRVSLIHVHDLAAALAALAREPVLKARVLEVDDGRAQGYSWPEMAALAQRVLGRPVRLHLLPRVLVQAVALGADIAAALSGRAFMLSRQKVNELYHHDWVARSPKVQECVHWTPARQFAEGFLDTLEHFCRRGRLPESRLPRRRRECEELEEPS